MSMSRENGQSFSHQKGSSLEYLFARLSLMTTSLLAQIDALMCAHFVFIFYLTPPEKSSLKSVARQLKSSTFFCLGTQSRFVSWLPSCKIFTMRRKKIWESALWQQDCSSKRIYIYIKQQEKHLPNTIFSHVFWFTGQTLWSNLKLGILFIMHRSHMNVNIHTPWQFLTRIFHSLFSFPTQQHMQKYTKNVSS